ncbi:MAG TPA: hypothetical protein VHU18_03520 [Rhizomicrobium sp.]|jgi:hypothetical protein|nr:hypothetical protein [Rhizomicrobium sp.]
MTKDKFKTLCDQVLIPRIGDAIHQQFSEALETQEAIAREIARIGIAMDRALVILDRMEGHARH